MAKKTLKTIANKEDKMFLLSMMSNLKTSMAGKDEVAISQAAIKQTTNNKEMKQKKLCVEAAVCYTYVERQYYHTQTQAQITKLTVNLN